MYVVFLGVVTLPFIVKKRMQELNCMTYVMFTGVISLIALLTIKLRADGSYESRFPNEHAETEKPNLTFEHLIDCINIGIASHGFVITFFPIYIDMKEEAQRPPMIILLALSIRMKIQNKIKRLVRGFPSIAI